MLAEVQSATRTGAYHQGCWSVQLQIAFLEVKAVDYVFEHMEEVKI